MASTFETGELSASEAAFSAGLLRRFSVDEYFRMIEAGIFAEHERLELLDGRIVTMMTRLPPHEVCLRLVSKALDRVLPTDYDLRVQSTVKLKESAPEPDCAVVIGDTRRYKDHHPGPTEIALVIEVSDTSLRIDRIDKANIYARDRLPTYWVFNLNERQVEALTEPSGDGPTAAYRVTTIYKESDHLPLVLGGQQVADFLVGDLLP